MAELEDGVEGVGGVTRTEKRALEWSVAVGMEEFRMRGAMEWRRLSAIAGVLWDGRLEDWKTPRLNEEEKKGRKRRLMEKEKEKEKGERRKDETDERR